MEPTEREPTESELLARIERNALRQLDEQLAKKSASVADRPRAA